MEGGTNLGLLPGTCMYTSKHKEHTERTWWETPSTAMETSECLAFGSGWNITSDVCVCSHMEKAMPVKYKKRAQERDEKSEGQNYSRDRGGTGREREKLQTALMVHDESQQQTVAFRKNTI